MPISSLDKAANASLRIAECSILKSTLTALEHILPQYESQGPSQKPVHLILSYHTRDPCPLYLLHAVYIVITAVSHPYVTYRDLICKPKVPPPGPLLVQGRTSVRLSSNVIIAGCTFPLRTALYRTPQNVTLNGRRSTLNDVVNPRDFLIPSHRNNLRGLVLINKQSASDQLPCIPLLEII